MPGARAAARGRAAHVVKLRHAGARAPLRPRRARGRGGGGVASTPRGGGARRAWCDARGSVEPAAPRAHLAGRECSRPQARGRGSPARRRRFRHRPRRARRALCTPLGQSRGPRPRPKHTTAGRGSPACRCPHRRRRPRRARRALCTPLVRNGGSGAAQRSGRLGERGEGEGRRGWQRESARACVTARGARGWLAARAPEAAAAAAAPAYLAAPAPGAAGVARGAPARARAGARAPRGPNPRAAPPPRPAPPPLNRADPPGWSEPPHPAPFLRRPNSALTHSCADHHAPAEAGRRGARRDRPRPARGARDAGERPAKGLWAARLADHGFFVFPQ